MPVKAAPFGGGLRPGYRKRRTRAGGSSSSISAHSSSSVIGLPISLVRLLQRSRLTAAAEIVNSPLGVSSKLPLKHNHFVGPFDSKLLESFLERADTRESGRKALPRPACNRQAFQYESFNIESKHQVRFSYPRVFYIDFIVSTNTETGRSLQLGEVWASNTSRLAAKDRRRHPP